MHTMNPGHAIRGSLDAFFRPRAVAVIGASSTPGKLGHTVVRNLIDGGFSGAIYAVNPSGADIAGAKSVATLGAIGTVVDLAFLAVPAARAHAAIRDCAAHGVRAVVIGASGFAELGTQEGRALQDAIAATAAGRSMRIIGPNTNGLMSVHDALSLGYNASHGERIRPGTVSVLSHSGALFDGIAKRLQGFGAGLSRFVAVGNEIDVSLLELLEALADDATTEVIGLVIEGLSDGPRLRRAANQLATAGKRVVVLKIGRSREGAGAALAHSSRLAGSARAWDALLESCGFVSVRTVEALAGACAVLAGPRAPRGDAGSLLCVTTSGAGGAILADFAVERGLPLVAQWTHMRASQIISALPTAAAIRNPIDMGSLGDWALLAPVLAALEEEGICGPTAVYAHVAPAPGMAAHLADALLARRARCGQPVVVLTPGGLGAEVEARYTSAGIPVFHDAVTCFDSLAAHFQQQSQLSTAIAGTSSSAVGHAGGAGRGDPTVDLAMAGALLRGAGCGATLSELESAGLLRAAGVLIVPSAVAHDLSEALRAAAGVGFPLVLKALVPGIAHKHQAGLVALNIDSDAALHDAFELQARRAEALAQGGRTQWLLQPMVRGELELIAGISAEPGLGHFLLWGLGGVHAEVFDQVDLLALPTTREALVARLESSRVGRLVAAIDPSGGAIGTLANALESLGALVAAHGDLITSIDVNPMLVTGRSVLAVDALVITAGTASG